MERQMERIRWPGNLQKRQIKECLKEYSRTDQVEKDQKGRSRDRRRIQEDQKEKHRGDRRQGVRGWKQE